MWSWDEILNIALFELWERRGAKWLGAVTDRWQEGRAALSHLRDRWIPAPPHREEPRMDATITPPMAPGMLGRALLAKLDADTVAAITAAAAEELRQEVHEAAVAEARAQLDGTFERRRERAQSAETIVVSMFSQLTGGVDQQPTYLFSGGRGLSALDLGAVNAIPGYAVERLRSEASPSPRIVACRLADGRTVTRTRFWLRTVTPSGVEDEADDEADEAAPAVALPEAVPPA